MKRSRSIMAMVSDYLAMAFILPVSIFVGYAIGYMLDKAFGTKYLYLVFLLVGIASGFVQLIRQILRDTRDSDNGS
ncbi:MAG TPA: AtpZ/AtpI family protein [Bryobacteraceae bacterium]|nr:AtpZ/AtpI family protein [Bryobacteraceae bacterium]